MKQITIDLIREFKIKQLGYDFLGYKLMKGDIYTAHHLIVPARFGGKLTRENTAVLCGKTAHPYLHLIENKDYDIFCYLTSEMIDMNILGRLDIKNLKNIDELLLQFEKEHCDDRDKKGKRLIKQEYYWRERPWQK